MRKEILGIFFIILLGIIVFYVYRIWLILYKNECCKLSDNYLKKSFKLEKQDKKRFCGLLTFLKLRTLTAIFSWKFSKLNAKEICQACLNFWEGVEKDLNAGMLNRNECYSCKENKKPAKVQKISDKDWVWFCQDCNIINFKNL